MKDLKTDLDLFLAGKPQTFARPSRRKPAAITAVIILIAAVAVNMWPTGGPSRRDIIVPSPVDRPSPVDTTLVALDALRVDPDIHVRVWTNKGQDTVYRAGDRMNIHVQSNRDGYLRLYYRQADRTVVRLVENEYVSGSAGYMFPISADGYEVTADPSGEETIMAVVSSVSFDQVRPKADTDLADRIMARLPIWTVGHAMQNSAERERFRGIRLPPAKTGYNRSIVTITISPQN